MDGRDPGTTRADLPDGTAEQSPGGRIARLAAEILADHVRAGKGDIDPEEMIESRLDFDPTESQGVVNAIKRIIEGKAAGGGASVRGTVKSAKTKTSQRDTAYLTIPTDQIVRDIITQARKVSAGRPDGTEPRGRQQLR